MEWVGLLDCNNFFVSCERLFRPDLQKRPTVVLSSNDGCVVARSPEIKALGIPMGVPYFKVKNELAAHHTEVFSSNFPLYRDISRRVMDSLGGCVGTYEQYSVDEAFFKLTGTDEEVLQRSHTIKKKIEQEVGVPISIGVAHTKTLAKFANGLAKKESGVYVLGNEKWVQQQPSVPLSQIWGVGRQTAQKMQDHGLCTVTDLLTADRSRIDALFGIAGVRLQAELAGTHNDRLSRSGSQIQQSIMSSRSFKDATNDITILENAIAYHVGEVAAELRSLQAVCGSLNVHILPSRHGEWLLRGGSQESLLVRPSSDTRVLLTEALALVRELWEKDVPYKKAGVVVSLISDASTKQLELFADTKRDDTAAVFKVMDIVNGRFGKSALTIGRVPSHSNWQASRQFCSPRYTTNWTELATVKA
ncbi:Y-family DNA polymerase [Candidatus Kaiserbacteria bacterium]|nr:Y-family DNA polymerase [Candidatus Kaiserbacteria bacterium]MCB9811913.1 Y-family DNA polymerase [Candidatus Nomurabacteria bacterium]